MKYGWLKGSLGATSVSITSRPSRTKGNLFAESRGVLQDLVRRKSQPVPWTMVRVPYENLLSVTTLEHYPQGIEERRASSRHVLQKANIESVTSRPPDCRWSRVSFASTLRAKCPAPPVPDALSQAFGVEIRLQ